ncbi:hypothetical protein GCM10020001_091680 [Nonomuraea salmonea]
MYQPGFSSRLRRMTAGGDGVVVAQADHGGEHLVAAGQGAQLGDGLGLADGGGQPEPVLDPDRLGHGDGHEVGDGLEAHGLEHALLLGLGGADMPGRERRS